MKKFDVIIIGSGQAGTPLAFKLAGIGKEVAFIEKEHFGGTCLNTGCTPTKAYVASARRMFDTKNGEEFGIHIPAGARTDLAKVKKRKDDLIKGSVEGIKKGIKDNEHITHIAGTASFIGEKTMEVNGEEITAEEIYINVGGRPRMPEEYKAVGPLNNQSILELTELPEHLVIVGGSYIGLEFGQMFKRFGCEVTIVEKNSAIISREDDDISASIQKTLENEGVKFRLNATCMGAKKLDDGQICVNVNCDQGEPQVIGTHVLLAIGRVPNTDLLNLEKAGIKTDEKGFIKVNDYLETNVPGIYALGDCNGEGAFTHTAYNDFEIIANHKLEGGNRKVSDRILTYGLFVDPPLGRAGMTLSQAKKTGKKLLVGKREMSKIARAKEKGETDGFMRVVVDAETMQIMGASILGVGGDEVVSGILNIMTAKQPYTVIRDSVQIHPTVSELIPTLLEGLKPMED
ncbi:mercuric reductase [Sediminicola sp. YIK13]|uniref:FAD-containing oxidoreductase n=1 Tax=Sediminicola sp. YIK13 TaxID=1453352 RepID=UPI000720E377|nr:FAD-containing oxidoreductase [Sediminicola sp. YIK13]ALM06515.1 mercuric reductase [Sediminicola sp. YIK13]